MLSGSVREHQHQVQTVLFLRAPSRKFACHFPNCQPSRPARFRNVNLARNVAISCNIMHYHIESQTDTVPTEPCGAFAKVRTRSLLVLRRQKLGILDVFCSGVPDTQ